VPQRQNVITIPSVELQGEGSWVKLRKLTVGESKSLVRSIKTADLQNVTDMKTLQSMGDVEVILEISASTLASLILAWNWVDTEGNPLPLPKDKPEVLDELTTEEQQFLFEAISGKAKKNGSLTN